VILSIPVLSPVLKRFLIRHIPSPGNAYFKKKLEPETSVWIHDDEKPRCDYFKLRKSFYAPPSNYVKSHFWPQEETYTCMIISRMRFYLTCKITPTLWKFWNEKWLLYILRNDVLCLIFKVWTKWWVFWHPLSQKMYMYVECLVNFQYGSL